MANPKIIYNNLWRKGTALTASPVALAQHPLTDTQIDTLSMYFRASAATSPCYLPMNLGAGAGAIDFLAILGHNIPAGTTVTFEHDDNADFSSPTSVPITYNATNIFQFFTAFTEQYVRVKLVKGGGFASAPQVATIVCGAYFELSKTVGLGYEEGYEDFSGLEYSDSQILFAQEKEIIEVRNLPFRGLDDTTRVNILLFFNECGIHKAFIICFDSTDANNKSHWVVNSELISPKYEQDDCWHWQLTIRKIV